MGRRLVIVSGSDGGQAGLHLFNAYKPADLKAKHESCIFTHESNCPFKDLQQIDGYNLEVCWRLLQIKLKFLFCRLRQNTEFLTSLAVLRNNEVNI